MSIIIHSMTQAQKIKKKVNKQAQIIYEIFVDSL